MNKHQKRAILVKINVLPVQSTIFYHNKEMAMFHRFDKVVYANYGACTITETDAHISFDGGSEKTYYVLSPSSKRDGTVYVPMDHEDLMTPVMDRTEALSLIESIDRIVTDDFNDANSKTVEEHFKNRLRQCDCATAVCVLKTMRERITEQKRKKRLPSSMYTRLFDQANHRVLSELSAALEIEEDEVAQFIVAHNHSAEI